MIRPISIMSFNNSNNQRKMPSFTAKPPETQGAFKFYRNILKEGKKKFSGIIDCYFPDKLGNNGEKVTLEFKKGILQTVERFSAPFGYLLKFTSGGEKLIQFKKPVKSLYKKEYEYSNATGELMKVTKNGETVFDKTYHFNPYFDYPIEKHINGNIIMHFDKNNTKKYTTFIDKYLRSEYIYNEPQGYFTEFRQLLDKNSFNSVVRLAGMGKPLPPNIVIESVPQKAITHINNPKSKDSLQITEYGANAKPEWIKGYNKRHELSYIIKCDYDNIGRLLKRNMLNISESTNQIDEFDIKTGLPIRTKLYDINGKMTEDILRKFEIIEDTPILKLNIHKYYSADEHLARVEKDIESGNIHVCINEIHGKNNQIYSSKTRYNIDTETMIDEHFYSPSKTEISEKEFMKAIRSL